MGRDAAKLQHEGREAPREELRALLVYEPLSVIIMNHSI